MSPFYNFQSYLNTYCTKFKGPPPPKLPLGHQKNGQFSTPKTFLHHLHVIET